MVAPHTRGSAWLTTQTTASHEGCPAHAGIGPGNIIAADYYQRLPRTRGDRPQIGESRQDDEEVAPHTRGSASRVRPRRFERFGCPAHAGIGPVAADRGQRPGWLPRTRGDRPQRCANYSVNTRVAPHTRGSALTRTVTNISEMGCPAHAGIGRRSQSKRATLRRLPRTRGDRPNDVTAYDLSTRVAPHTRGSAAHSRHE